MNQYSTHNNGPRRRTCRYNSATGEGLGRMGRGAARGNTDKDSQCRNTGRR